MIGQFHDFDACIKCSLCTQVCPVAAKTGRYPGPKQAGPDAERFRHPDERSVDPWISLCLDCKQCESVCPSGVPITHVITTAKAKRVGETGVTTATRLLTHIYLLGPAGSLLSPLANVVTGTPVVRRAMEVFSGVASRRPLPPYASPTFQKWMKGRQGSGSGGEVLYFHGCYTDRNEPSVGMAAVECLERSEIGVACPESRCCAIALLGNGDFRGARKLAKENIEVFSSALDKGRDIVFSSPSCGLAIKREYLEVLELKEMEGIAPRIHDIFEYMLLLDERGAWNRDFGALEMRALYHVPCHLKALGVGYPALDVLEKVPGVRINELDAGCCGLGGTYGFKKEGYPLSMEIGGNLSKRLRAYPDLPVLSDCEGCRMQINHLSGRRTLHPLEVLARAYPAASSG